MLGFLKMIWTEKVILALPPKDALKECVSCVIQQFLRGGGNKLSFLVIVETVLSQVRKYLSDRKQCEGIHDDFSTQNSFGGTVPCGLVLVQERYYLDYKVDRKLWASFLLFPHKGVYVSKTKSVLSEELLVYGCDF